MKKRLRILLPLLFIVIASIFGYNKLKNLDDDGSLRFSGNIEVTEARMSFKIPGRLHKRLVEEGDVVSAGQSLATIEKIDQSIAVASAEASLAFANAVLAELEAGSRQEEIDRAEARVMQARHSLSELQNGSRSQEIKSASAERERAMAAEQLAIVQLHQAKIDFDRYAKLYKNGSVSQNSFESFKTLYETAEYRVNEAKARTEVTKEQLGLLEAGPRIEQISRAAAGLKQAEAEYALIKAGPRKESLDQARAKVQVAAETVRQARQQLTYTELVAPMNAVVLSSSAEPGEYLNPASPVVTLGRLDKPWLRAYIHEKDLGRIQLNQKVEVSTDSFPDKSYTGRVSYISSQAEFTPKTVQTFEERVKLMFRIKVALDNPNHELKPGMPADGFIDLTDL
jgi:HlyD family secretion protein